jgi:hypothetical protein
MMREGKYILVLTTCVFVQLGSGDTTQRSSPLALVGLSSGVAMVSCGHVRLFANAV